MDAQMLSVFVFVLFFTQQIKSTLTFLKTTRYTNQFQHQLRPKFFFLCGDYRMSNMIKHLFI